MIKAFVFVLFSLSAGTVAYARTIVVRSGEHAGFSRLVMLLPPDAEWTMNDSGDIRVLSVDSKSIKFDVSQVFTLIPRTRLADLTQSGPGSDLVLSLACACSVSSFIEKSGYLVIDIQDGSAESGQRGMVLNLPVNQSPYRFAIGEPLSQVGSSESHVVHLPVVVSPMHITQHVTQMAKPSPQPAGSHEPMADRQIIRPRGNLNISEERLLAQINRASNQGLLDLRVKPEVKRHAAMQPDMTEASGAEGHGMQHVRPLPVSLTATTVIDRDLASVARSIDHTGAEMMCLHSDKVALNDWGGKQPFDAEISHWRAQLFGERDKVNSESALGLARAYLHFGFGAEAGMSVDLSMVSNLESLVLKALAEILEFEHPPLNTPFSGQQHCDSDVALWAILAENNIAAEVNTNAVQQAFLRLPLHLRSYLGPKISQIFTEAGDGPMAKFILRAMARVDIEPGSGVELAKAAVAELHGDTETEELELKISLSTGSEHSPEALVRLIANIYESRDAVSPDLYDLAAAYALEYRNTGKGADLRRTNAIALALAGEFNRAFYKLSDIEKRDGYEKRQLALLPLIELLTERADDVTFSRLAMAVSPKETNAIPASTGNQVARRLLDLGFPELASSWVERGDKHTSTAGRLLRAEIALMRHLPNRAMVEVLGLSGPEADKLRAQAMWQEGDYQKAAQMLSAAGEHDAAARGFWMAETWEEVPEQADARYGSIVAGSIDLRKHDEGVALLTPLAEARALMQNSSDARAGIEELLLAATVDSAHSE